MWRSVDVDTVQTVNEICNMKPERDTLKGETFRHRFHGRCHKYVLENKIQRCLANLQWKENKLNSC
jgi:hypothetical protein